MPHNHPMADAPLPDMNGAIDSNSNDAARALTRRLADFFYSRKLSIVEWLILVVYLMVVYLSNLLAVEFQPDETFWIVSSTRLDKFVGRDFDSPIWTAEPLISYEVRPVPSYIVAIGQRLGGLHGEDLPAYWDWSLTGAENIARGAMPSARALWLSRLPMALISVFSLLVTIGLLAVSHSRLAAYLFGWISINDYFLLHLRRAMSEAPLVLFTILVLYASYRLLQAVRGKPMTSVVMWSVLAGLFSGLAGQSKLTGLACAAIPILGSLLFISRSTDFPMQYRKRIILTGTFFVICPTLLLFLLSYPFFYENTAHRILTTFVIRGQVVASQAQLYPTQTIQPDQRSILLFRRIFAYPLSFHSHPAAATIFHWINFSLAGLGLWYSIRQAGKRAGNQPIHIVLLTGALVCAAPMLLIPLDWDRYYIYPIFFTCVFFAMGMARLLFSGASCLRA